MTERARFETIDGNIYLEDDGPTAAITYGPVNPMWANYPALEVLQDPSIAHDYFEEFHNLAIGDFTVTTTEAGTGSATEALTDEIGGVLLITNAAGDNDMDQFQVGTATTGESFILAQRQPLWFEARLKVNNATEAQFFVGLASVDTSLMAGVNDSVHLSNADGAADISYHTEITDGTETTADTGVNVVADTYNRLGFRWDGESTVEFWIDGVLVGTSTTNLPLGEMKVSFQVTNRVVATAKTMSVDYIRCVQLQQRAALVP